MNKITFLLFFTSSLFSYDFVGVHYMASLRKCIPATLKQVHETCDLAVISSHATLIEKITVTPESGGLTLLYILSESHACFKFMGNDLFVDLFTCGTSCDWRQFHDVLIDYFEPESVSLTVTRRD